jgi:hypothetical protein
LGGGLLRCGVEGERMRGFWVKDLGFRGEV